MMLSETILGILLIFATNNINTNLNKKISNFKIKQLYFFPFKSYISVIENYISSYNSKISLSLYALINNILNKDISTSCYAQKKINIISQNNFQMNNFYEIYKIKCNQNLKYYKFFRKIKKFFSNFYYTTKFIFYIKIIKIASIFIARKNIKINYNFFYKNFFQLIIFHNTIKNIIKNLKNIINDFYFNHFPELTTIKLKFTKIIALLLLILNNKKIITQIDEKRLLLIYNIIGNKNHTKKIIFKYIWYNKKILKENDKVLLNYIIKSTIYLIKLNVNIETYIKKILRITTPNIYNFVGFTFINKLITNFGTLLNLTQAPLLKIKTLISSKYFKKYFFNIFRNLFNKTFLFDNNRILNCYSFAYNLYWAEKIKSFLSLKISLLAKIDMYVKDINEIFIIRLKKKVNFNKKGFKKI
uniref:Nucleolar protein Nop56-like protein n=1 Tax=Lotharella vacuolata TaxID=74820 RepID=A0A0H5BQS8_9EUKA|nr:nucleolar protein Nop56-like protein [Lotharella vacuolata]